MPKQIQTHTFGTALVRKFGLKGRFQPVLDETIVPVTIIDSSEAERHAVGGMFGPASGAGNQNTLFFHNPPGSGVVVELVRWTVVSGTPATDFVEVLLIPASAGFGLAGTSAWRDSALAGIPRASFNINAAGAGVLGMPQYRIESDSIQWEGSYFLQPGAHLTFRQNAQNDTLNLTVQWIERNLIGSVGA